MSGGAHIAESGLRCEISACGIVELRWAFLKIGPTASLGYFFAGDMRPRERIHQSSSSNQ